MLAGFALVWWLTESTGSATVLAMATLAQLLPGVLLGPFVGTMVDRWNRQTVMLVADTAIAVLSAWLAYLFYAGTLQPWHVYGIMAARSLGGAFHWPAMSASTSLMVPEEHLSRVAGINQAMHGILNIVAPPLGALLMTVMPFEAIMGIDVVSAAFAILPLFFVRIPQPTRRASGGRERVQASFWNELYQGLQCVWVWPGLRVLVLMAMGVNFVFTPAGSLLPLLVTNRFGLGALELGWINSAWGLGVVLGGLALGVWGGFRRRILTSLLGLVGMGVGALLVGLAPAAAFGLALGAMLLTGFMNPITNGPLHAIFQSSVAPEMQGRVFSVVGSACSAMAPLGMVIAGPVADALGIQSWFILAGASCILMAVVGRTNAAVMTLEDHVHAPVVGEAEAPVPAVTPASMGAD
jgi:DHA3 family macrolide efflux protein-like MFS transporter